MGYPSYQKITQWYGICKSRLCLMPLYIYHFHLVTPWPILTASLGTLSPSDIVKFFIFPQCHLKIPTNEEHKFTLFASILFVKIWKIRNQTIFAGHTRTQRKVLKRLSVLWSHIGLVSIISTPPLLFWKPPHIDRVKISFCVAKMNLVRFCLLTRHSMFLYDNASSK